MPHAFVVFLGALYIIYIFPFCLLFWFPFLNSRRCLTSSRAPRCPSSIRTFRCWCASCSRSRRIASSTGWSANAPRTWSWSSFRCVCVLGRGCPFLGDNVCFYSHSVFTHNCDFYYCLMRLFSYHYNSRYFTSLHLFYNSSKIIQISIIIAIMNLFHFVFLHIHPPTQLTLSPLPHRSSRKRWRRTTSWPTFSSAPSR
jgi:hypothetical protein